MHTSLIPSLISLTGNQNLNTKLFFSRIIISKHLSSSLLVCNLLFYVIPLRIAADLEGNLKPPMPLLPSISSTASLVEHDSPDRASSLQSSSSSSNGGSQLSRFSRTLRAVETERQRQRTRLMVRPSSLEKLELLLV